MSIHHSFGTVFSSINTRFSHACRKSSWICWWPLLPGFCFQPVGKKMGPKNVAMFFVAWYLYDKPEAKMIKSYFLSKPASLSERNHRKLKWSLKMPPWRCKKWTKNDHHDPRCHGVGHWSLGISTFRSKWSTMWLWLGACGSICSAKGDVIRYAS